MTQKQYDVYEAIITRRPGEIVIAFPSELPSIDHIKLGDGWRIHSHHMTNRIHVRLDREDANETILIVAKRVVHRVGEADL